MRPTTVDMDQCPKAMINSSDQPGIAANETKRLRSRLLDPNLTPSEASQIATQIARQVAIHDDPEARMAELARGPFKSASDSNAARLEYNALCSRVNSRNITTTKFDSAKSVGLTLAALNSDAEYDVPTLIECMQAQAKSLTQSDKAGIKSLLAQQAVLANHVGQNTIAQAGNAPTTLARALTAKYGVSMLESSARIAEKLARIGQPKQGNIFTNRANIAHNQLIQNCGSATGIDDATP